MQFLKKIIIVSIIFSFLTPSASFAHPGRTDSKGCHVCKTKCIEKWNLEYGEYHCHKPKKIKKSIKKVSKRKVKKINNR